MSKRKVLRWHRSVASPGTWWSEIDGREIADAWPSADNEPRGWHWSLDGSSEILAVGDETQGTEPTLARAKARVKEAIGLP